MGDRLVLYYTFGNHMHWVDMEWLWGYHALPGSVRDMLHFCEETGAKGNVNFDGIGFEKLAAEAPDALAALKNAVLDGQIEVVGASYGQPYGLFHGGESNVRQRVYGVRTVQRLLDIRPKTFWEEEFDFFPQLPQLLHGVGFEYGSLFFQWTWHTPYVPEETLPAIWWEGQDGSRILAAPRNALNLHQWPEDFAALLASNIPKMIKAPGIVQWLELLPSKDWMCRSELMIPPLKALLDYPDYDVQMVTLSKYLDIARGHAEPRRYTLDDVFHGLSLGKNGDLFRRMSRQAEQQLLTAEALSSLAGLFGRPYPSWNVYPVWELEEAWRELLSAQHHDNDECEGLCGHVGMRSYERSLGLSGHVLERTAQLLAARTAGPAGRQVIFNPLGWPQEAVVLDEAKGSFVCVKGIPAFGYKVLGGDEEAVAVPKLIETKREVSLERGGLRVSVDRTRGVMTQVVSTQFPDGLLEADMPLADLWMRRGNALEPFTEANVSVAERLGQPLIVIERRGQDGALVTVEVSLALELDAVDITYRAKDLPRPDPGFAGALRTTLGIVGEDVGLIHDHPYGVSPIRAKGTYQRKYPTGDWMTSPQVFETVENPFTALQFLDMMLGDRGLLYLHDGNQSMLRRGNRIEHLLTLYDPWDEAYFIADVEVKTRLVPHGRITNLERWQLAQVFTRQPMVIRADGENGDLPSVFAPIVKSGTSVALTAFYRESEDVARSFPNYAGRGMEYPYVLRLVEFDGEETSVRLEFPGEVAAVFRTNLLGEIGESLAVTRHQGTSAVEVTLRPFEIVTLYLDLVRGRKVSRDLDARRAVWAQVHRTGEHR